MRKTFCDKCEEELERGELGKLGEILTVEHTDLNREGAKSVLWKKHVGKHLCLSCLDEFLALLNSFIPDFMKKE